MSALRSKIASLPVNLDRPKFVIVPEIYTFAAEKEFYSLGNGSFDVRVTSLTKMYYDFLPRPEALSRAEAVAIISAIARKNAESLTYYAGAFSRRGFAEKVYETIEKLAQSAIEPQALTSSNALIERKLKDLRLIYSLYRQATGGKSSDANGRVEALTRYIAENRSDADGSEIYFVNFDLFTARQRALIDVMDKKAACVEIYAADMPEKYSFPASPTVYAASSAKDECDRIADFILNDVTEGLRFGDISVVGENIDYNKLKRAFDARGIRFYFDKRKRLSDSEPGILLQRVLRCAAGGMTGDNMILLAGNRLACPELDLRDRFISFVKAHSAFFVSPVKQFDMPDDPDCPEAEKLRVRLAALTDVFMRKKTLTAAEFAGSVAEIFDKVNLNENDEKNGRYCRLLGDAARSLEKAYGEDAADAEELAASYFGIADSIAVPLIPNETDAVYVGPVNSRRGFACKKLYITGFNDGVLPAVTDDPGLLNDYDILRLKDDGLAIEPTSERQNALMRDEVLQLASAAEKLTLTYVSDGENKKSYLLRMIEKSAGVSEDAELDSEWFAAVAENGGEEEILAAYPSRAACIKAAFSDREGEGYDAIKAAVREETDEIRSDLSLNAGDFTEGGINLIRCSASSLQDYFECPKMYFYRHALGIKKAADGKIEPSDVGTLLHRIIERFVKAGKFGNPRLEGAKIADEELEKHSEYALESNARLRGYIKRDAVFLCEKTAAQLTGNAFECLGTEIRYGDDDDEKTAIRPSGVTLCGMVDRIDVFGKYARVIDYKSGSSVDLKPDDIYYGKKLQLPVYSEVARRMGYTPAAMFYFPVNDSKEAGLLKGYCVSDPALIGEMTKNEKILAFDPGKKNRALDRENFDALIKYALAAAEKAVAAIKKGYCGARPLSASGKKLRCDYCDYASVCKGRRALRVPEKHTIDDLKRAVTHESD